MKFPNQVTVRARDTGNITNTYRVPTKNPEITIEWWYDARSKNWIVQLKDENDCQIGNAEYVYDRPTAEKIVKHLLSVRVSKALEHMGAYFAGQRVAEQEQRPAHWAFGAIAVRS